jgi:hypothetical protein
MKSISRILAILVMMVAVLALAVPAQAHTHTIVTQGVTRTTLANGQLHGPFVNGVSCGGDPAAYGLESAHHGPDAGTAGKADGCYQTTGSVAPGADVASPVIR